MTLTIQIKRNYRDFFEFVTIIIMLVQSTPIVMSIVSSSYIRLNLRSVRISIKLYICGKTSILLP